MLQYQVTRPEKAPFRRFRESPPTCRQDEVKPTARPLPPGQSFGNRGSSTVLVSYDRIPAWHQDNEHIRHGYRSETNSASRCLASWLYVHNETGNVVTHLIPTIASITIGIAHSVNFPVRYPTSSSTARLIFSTFFFAAAMCFGISTSYHTMMNHSAAISHLWLRIDYVGVIIMMLGDFVSGIYVCFRCEPHLQTIY